MPNQPTKAPVFDYRPGHSGSRAPDSYVERLPKYVRDPNDGYVRQIDGPVHYNDHPSMTPNGRGLHGGVVQHDKDGLSRAVYH